MQPCKIALQLCLQGLSRRVVCVCVCMHIHISCWVSDEKKFVCQRVRPDLHVGTWEESLRLHQNGRWAAYCHAAQWNLQQGQWHHPPAPWAKLATLAEQTRLEKLMQHWAQMESGKESSVEELKQVCCGKKQKWYQCLVKCLVAVQSVKQ